MKFDFDKELEACKKKKRAYETIVFTVGCGRMLSLITDKKDIRKGMEKAIEFIKKQEGFLGVYQVDLWNTLLLFDSVNDAKKCRNLLESEGVQCANYIVPILVETKYIKEQENE